MKNTFSAVIDTGNTFQQVMTPAVDLEKSHFPARIRKQAKMTNTLPTILYAEHGARRRLRLAADLERSGFLVRIAECATAALELSARRAFDVMIIDYELPDMTGRNSRRK
jgi:PleD family two-component response regulator